MKKHKWHLIIVAILALFAFVILPYMRGPQSSFNECVLRNDSVLFITPDGGTVCSIRRNKSTTST